MCDYKFMNLLKEIKHLYRMARDEFSAEVIKENQDLAETEEQLI